MSNEIFEASARAFQALLEQVQGLYDLPKSGYGKLSLAEITSHIAFIQGSDYPENVAAEIIQSEVKFLAFLKKLGKTGIFPDSANLGSFKTDNQGLIERFYGPALMKKDDAVYLRVGSVFFPVTVEDTTRIKIASLVGKVQFRDVEVGDDTFLRAFCILRDEDIKFKVGVLIHKDFEAVRSEDLDLQFDDGLTLLDVLAEAGSGSKYCKLADLDVGVPYTAIGVDANGNPDYGRFRLVIETGDGEKILSLNRALKDTLEDHAEKLEAAGAYSLDAMNRHFNGYILTVLEKEMKGTRCFAKARFTPKNSMKEWLENQKQLAANGSANTAVKTLASAPIDVQPAPATISPTAEIDLDSIPF